MVRPQRQTVVHARTRLPVWLGGVDGGLAEPALADHLCELAPHAVAECGLHEGVFSMLRGGGNAIGEELVDHPLIKAVTFTGSEGGGMALSRRAQLHPDPIPMFCEMTSVNPNFVLPAAPAARGAEIGDGFAERMLVNVGQACLKPAILLAVDAPGYSEMREAAAARVRVMAARPMLTPGIHDAYEAGSQAQRDSGAAVITEGPGPAGAWEDRSRLLDVDGDQFIADPSVEEEVFGPFAPIVRFTRIDQLLEAAQSFRGQLTAMMHIDKPDHGDAARLLPILERRTNRVVVNAYSHPQEVGYATIHGGPLPATTDSRLTSVGMTAIDRFLRPVTYQGFPEALLPDALAADNPDGLWRLVDGHLTGPEQTPAPLVCHRPRGDGTRGKCAVRTGVCGSTTRTVRREPRRA
ncbi:aldehyde dehydrogenase family protein [Streptomyces sp. NPDC005122]